MLVVQRDVAETICMGRQYYVYMLANYKNGTLYTGVTNDLQRRMYEHKNGICEGFSARYYTERLVWFVETNDVGSAIELEKKIKNRGRAWKIRVIEKDNPDWVDNSVGW